MTTGLPDTNPWAEVFEAVQTYGDEHVIDEDDPDLFVEKATRSACEHGSNPTLFLDALLDYQKQVFKTNQDLMALDRAIGIAQILLLEPKAGWKPLDRRLELCFLLYKKTEVRPEIPVFDKAIQLFETTLQSPDPSQDTTQLAGLLEFLLERRFQHSDRTEHLDGIISYFRQQQQTVHSDDIKRWLSQAALAKYLCKRYERQRKGSSLDEAFAIVTKHHLASLPDSFSQRHMCYDTVGSLFRVRGEQRTRTLQDRETDLEEAIKFGELALREENLSNTQRQVYETNLAVRISALARLKYQPEDLDRAVQLAEAAVMPSKLLCLTPIQVAIVYRELEYAHWNRFSKQHHSSDLDAAIKYARRALEVATKGQPGYCAYVTDLGTLLGMKYEEYEPHNTSLLDEAIEVLLMEASIVPINDPHFFDHRRSLSNRLRRRYLDRNHVEDLRDAISLLEEADGVLRPEIHDRAVHYNNFSNLQGLRYERYGNEADLKIAIQYSQDAIKCIGVDNVEVGPYYNTLARWLVAMYNDTRVMDYLERAIKSSEEGVKKLFDISPHRWLNMNTLSSIYRMKANRTGDSNFMSQAVDLSRRIVSECPKNHPQRAMFLLNLSSMLALCGTNAQTSQDEAGNQFEEAVHIAEEAYMNLNEDDPEAFLYVYEIGRLTMMLYWQTRDSEHLETAIDLGISASSTCPDDHPYRALINGDLGTRLELHPVFGRAEILKTYMSAIASTNSPPFHRALAAWAAGEYLAGIGLWHEASRILRRAVLEFLPRISPRWLPRDDQQYSLKQAAGIAALAVSVELNGLGDIERALVVMEAGHGIMAGLIMDSRGDITSLAKIDSGRALEYRHLQDRIAMSTLRPYERFDACTVPVEPQIVSLPGNFASIVPTNNIDDIRKEYETLTRLEAEIRTLEGFQDFGKPLDVSDIRKLARTGAIVSFNVTRFRSDAFVITDRIQLVELPRLNKTELEKRLQQLVGPSKLARQTNESRAHRNEKLREILAWLWDVAVGDIIKCLKFRAIQTKRTADVPRIWWTASGLMGLAPLHAAGRYQPDGMSIECTSMYAVSSYIPTLKALKYVQGRELRRSRESTEKLLIVSMPETADEPPLSADLECRQILESVSFRNKVILRSPLKTEVLQQLRDSTVVHFACHGKADASDPSSGALLVRHEDPKQHDPLTVRELAAVRHDRAQIAYLSACSTAENPVADLRDEVIHLASTFQLIGFPHVIGTLWEAADDTAREIARLFYVRLTAKMKHKGFDGDPRSVADALHEAVEKRRYREGGNFLGWVPFIHLGA